jgi:hypothetical protein
MLPALLNSAFFLEDQQWQESESSSSRMKATRGLSAATTKESSRKATTWVVHFRRTESDKRKLNPNPVRVIGETERAVRGAAEAVAPVTTLAPLASVASAGGRSQWLAADASVVLKSLRSFLCPVPGF